MTPYYETELGELEMENNMAKIVNPEYRARNLEVCTAYGLNAGLCNTFERMRARKDCPQWLLVALSDYIQRSNELIGVTRRHRDGQKKYIDRDETH